MITLPIYVLPGLFYFLEASPVRQSLIHIMDDFGNAFIPTIEMIAQWEYGLEYTHD